MFGDLNFRLELTNDVVRPIVDRLSEQGLDFLREKDELIKLRKQHKEDDSGIDFQILRDFKEAELNFPPTYKYDK